MGDREEVLNGLVGVEMWPIVSTLNDRYGDVAGLVRQFETHGLVSMLQSWVGNGPNRAITSIQLQHALGNEAVKLLTARAGLSTPALLVKLVLTLPRAIDALTPGGTLPVRSADPSAC